MKVSPANLTRLTVKYKGVFPDTKVVQALRAGPTPSSNDNAHGSETMPVWGPAFRALTSGENDVTELRIHHLVEYIRSIQEK